MSDIVTGLKSVENMAFFVCKSDDKQTFGRFILPGDEVMIFVLKIKKNV